jgi:hypothetical protein
LIECVFSTIAAGPSIPVKRFTVNRFTQVRLQAQGKESA